MHKFSVAERMRTQMHGHMIEEVSMSLDANYYETVSKSKAKN